MEKIQFNEEDDEITHRENQLFWQSLKNLKVPFTNTITLGRKFRKNVLKLSIFNSFGNQTAPQTQQGSAATTSDDFQNLNRFELRDSSCNPSSLPPPTPNSAKRAKLRILRKQKKLNKLECQLLGENEDNNSNTPNDTNNLLVYKTI